jgi:hypothetical protein
MTSRKKSFVFLNLHSPIARSHAEERLGAEFE